MTFLPLTSFSNFLFLFFSKCLLFYHPSDNPFHSPWPHCVSLDYSDLADWNSKLKKFLCPQISYRGGSYCLSLQGRDSQLLFFGDLLAALEQSGILASVSSSVQEKCWCHHCTWQGTVSDHLQVAEHEVKSQPLPPSSCFGAGEFAVQARGNASPGRLQSWGSTFVRSSWT